MTEYQSELVVDCRCRLGEGPAWFNGRVWWVDLTGKRVHDFDPTTGGHGFRQFEEIVTVVVPRQKGGIAYATENGFALSSGPDAPLKYVADPENHLLENRFNDGKCDPQGRLWAGTMSRHGVENAGSLYVLHTDLSYEQYVTNVTCSNGLAWHSDGRTMYYIDTPTKKVDAFDFDSDTGSITNRRAVITFPDGVGVPDGMTIDAENRLWVGMWGGGCVYHCDPATGEIRGKIAVGAKNVTSCTFAGPNLTDLYITTARDGTPDNELEALPHAGSLFKAQPGVRGCETNAFSG